MAHNERLVDAPPEAVFDVLADPRGYAYWVVGSIEIRDADPDWPQVGSRFHHTVGMGPLRLKDHTVVEDVELGRFLQLKTQARPLGNARVKLELERLDGATKVTMTEDAADKPTAFVFLPLTHLLVHGRNRRSLDRLAELAEGRRRSFRATKRMHPVGIHAKGAASRTRKRARDESLADPARRQSSSGAPSQGSPGRF